MDYKQRTERYNSDAVQALVAKWNDANSRMERCKQEMRDTEEEIVKNICPYKVGEVFANKDGKKYILEKIAVDTHNLRGGFCGKGVKFIDFFYTFRSIRKDGRPSMNGRSWVDIEDVKSTGEIYGKD